MRRLVQEAMILKDDSAERAIRTRPEVIECYRMTGDADYLLRVVCADFVAFERFLLDRQNSTERLFPLARPPDYSLGGRPRGEKLRERQ